jgi:2-keto-3-deoxygluconate permease
MIPRFKPLVPAATVMVATACLVTAILVPILTAAWSRRMAALAEPVKRRTEATTR